MRTLHLHTARLTEVPSQLCYVISLLFLCCFYLPGRAQRQADAQVGRSPWGAGDEIGTLNLLSDSTNLSLFRRVQSGKVFDLGVEYFVGMPGFTELHDPGYQQWLTHSPRGTVVGDHTGKGKVMNNKVSYTGDALSMYTHTGTHIDALNHFGLHGKIWNGYSADEYLSDRGWLKAGAEKIPPIVGRGVLIDVPKFRGEQVLAEDHVISLAELQQVIKAQHVEIHPGDIVFIRTGVMQHFYTNKERFMRNASGASVEAIKWLVEDRRVMTLGADNLGVEAMPSQDASNWLPVHTYLLAQRGTMFIELLYLEELSAQGVYEFLFIGAPLKLRGASAGPMRPLAIPLR